MYLLGPNYPKLKTTLRLALLKLKLLQRKKSELAEKTRKEIADLINAGKLQRAKYRVEHIIREDYYIDALEIIEMYCDLLLSRIALISNMKELDQGIVEAVSSLFWVAPQLTQDVQELKVITDILSSKYGSNYAEACRAEIVDTISETLKEKLSLPVPSKVLIEKYLVEIARSYNVFYIPDPQVMEGKHDETFNKFGGSGGSKTFAQPPRLLSFESRLKTLVRPSPIRFYFSTKGNNELNKNRVLGKTPHLTDSAVMDMEENNIVNELNKNQVLGETQHLTDSSVMDMEEKNIVNHLNSTTKSTSFRMKDDVDSLPMGSTEKLYNLPFTPKCSLPRTRIKENIYELTSKPMQECGFPKLSPVTTKRVSDLPQPPTISNENMMDLSLVPDDKINDLSDSCSTPNDMYDLPDLSTDKTYDSLKLGVECDNMSELFDAKEKDYNFRTDLDLPKLLTEFSEDFPNAFEENIQNSSDLSKTPNNQIYDFSQLPDLPPSSNDQIHSLVNENAHGLLKLPLVDDENNKCPGQLATPVNKDYNLPKAVPNNDLLDLPKLPSVPNLNNTKMKRKKEDVDFDELVRRFNAFKRR